MFQTEFEFTLPKGYLDGEGNLHRKGTMRLAKAIDEIVPLRDPRVKANPAYATVLILSRVITQLGALDEVSPRVIEDMYAHDLNHLYDLYQNINGTADAAASQPQTAEEATEETNDQEDEEETVSSGNPDQSWSPPSDSTASEMPASQPAYV